METIIAEPKGEASNSDVLSFRVGMYVYPQIAQCNSMLVYVYPQRLRNTILCSRMYVCHASTTIAQFSGQNVSPGTIMATDYCLAEYNHMYKRFKSLSHSLRITHDFSFTLKIHLNVC